MWSGCECQRMEESEMTKREYNTVIDVVGAMAIPWGEILATGVRYR